MRLNKKAIVLGGAVALAAPFVPSAQASTQVSASVPIPVHAEVDSTAVQCDNTGSTVEISGTLSLGGMKTKVTFKNNVKGTKQLSTVGESTVDVVSDSGDISVPKQPVRGGVGGNPWLAFQFTDGDGNALSSPVIIGRCVQGLVLTHLAEDLSLTGGASALASAVSCSQQGSTVNLDGSRGHHGVNGLLLMDNNKNKVVHESQAAAALSLNMLGGQTTHKGWGVGGAGGNPLVYVTFLNEQDAAISSELSLGRCSQLGS